MLIYLLCTMLGAALGLFAGAFGCAAAKADAAIEEIHERRRAHVAFSTPGSRKLDAFEDMVRAGLPLAQTDVLEVIDYTRRLRDRNAVLVAEKLAREAATERVPA